MAEYDIDRTKLTDDEKELVENMDDVVKYEAYMQEMTEATTAGLDGDSGRIRSRTPMWTCTSSPLYTRES